MPDILELHICLGGIPWLSAKTMRANACASYFTQTLMRKATIVSPKPRFDSKMAEHEKSLLQDNKFWLQFILSAQESEVQIVISRCAVDLHPHPCCVFCMWLLSHLIMQCYNHPFVPGCIHTQCLKFVSVCKNETELKSLYFMIHAQIRCQC